MFDNFLSEPDIYRQCQQYWLRSVEEVEASLGKAGTWNLALQRFYADGETPMKMDGNPIIEGISADSARAFQVIQYSPDLVGVTITAWIRPHERDYPEFPEELVIALTLSDRTVRTAKDLLRLWMTPSATLDDVNHLIERSKIISVGV